MNDLKIEVNYINYLNNPWGCIQTYGYDEICVHNTGSDASADNEWAYMNRMQTSGHPTVHYFVDDIKAIKCMPLSIDAWAVSDGAGKGGNTTDIHIEVCYSKSGGEKYKKALENTYKLIAILCKDLNWTPNGKIKFHYDYGTKYCPHRTLNDFGGDGYINSTKSASAATKLRNHIVDSVNSLLNDNNEEGSEDMAKLLDLINIELKQGVRAYYGSFENVEYGTDKVAIFTSETNVYTDITCDTRNASQSTIPVGKILFGWSCGRQTRNNGQEVLVYKWINSVGAVYFTIVHRYK